jgi:hypothetical protein
MARTAKSRAFASVAKAHHARTRANLVRQAERERAKAEALEVSTGVDETVALAEGRGEAFERPKQRPGERAKPVRRLNGLEYLKSRGVFTRDGVVDNELVRIGEVWGDLWRQGYGDLPLRSCMDDSPRGGHGDPTAKALVAAQARVVAQRRLRAMSGPVMDVPALYGALATIAGIGLTPRQYGLTDKCALVVQTNLIAALELMRAGVRRAA